MAHRLLAVFVALGLLAGLRPALSEPSSRSSGAYRVTSTLRPLAFPLPGSTGTVVLSHGSSVSITGKRPAGPWHVIVEQGEAALSVTGRTEACTIGGARYALRLDSGTAYYWCRAGGRGEGGTQVRGTGVLGRVDVPAGAQTTVKVGEGQGFTATADGRLEGSDARGTEAVTALVRLFDPAHAADAVRLPTTVPPSGDAKPADSNVQLRPLTLGTATVVPPTDRSIQAIETITKHRERLLVSRPGQGLAGPSVYVDFSPAAGGRPRNLVISGATGTVKFFMKPHWQVTLAPDTVVELTGAPPAEAHRKPTPDVKLLRGSMMCVEAGASPTTTGAVPIDGLEVAGAGNTVVGAKTLVFTAPAAPAPGTTVEPEAALDAARARFQPPPPAPAAAPPAPAAPPVATPVAAPAAAPVAAAPASPAPAAAPVAAAPASPAPLAAPVAAAPAAGAPAAGAPAAAPVAAAPAPASSGGGAPGANPLDVLANVSGSTGDGGAQNVGVAALALKGAMNDKRFKGGDGGAAGLGAASVLLGHAMKEQGESEGGLAGSLARKGAGIAETLGDEKVQAAAKASGESLLKTAVKDGGKSAETAAITLMAELPAQKTQIAQMVPLQAKMPGKNQQLDVTMLATLPPNRPDVKANGLEAVENAGGGAQVPVALVVPRDMPADPGADPAELKVMMTPAKETPKEVRDKVQNVKQNWDEASGVKRAPITKSGRHLKVIAGIVGGILALGLAWGGRRLMEVMQRAVLGTVRRRCPRCEMILDHYALAEIEPGHAQTHVFQMLGFDDIVEVPRQQRTRTQLLGWIAKQAAVAGSMKLKVRADWCQRCIQGRFTCELLGEHGVRDESSCEFNGADTRTLVEALSRREAADAKAGGAA